MCPSKVHSALLLMCVLQLACTSVPDKWLGLIRRDHLDCPKGFYMGFMDECEECNQCDPGFYAKTPCSPSSKIECGWCGAEFPVENEDFKEKCAEELRSHRVVEDMKRMQKEMHQDAKAQNRGGRFVILLEYLALGFLFTTSAVVCAKLALGFFARKSARCDFECPSPKKFIVRPSALLKTKKTYEPLAEDI
ncbi:hypothetical protein L596_003939 [Steinernema carpocapsae]|uniref:TNFR-Cys domain-containing protein n=1 Tax=Steinernema carpocapsae TaxID=34508 RepID=A0A4U8UVR5_STECR|nr:hypothetical protein L596_003939 [Steinernema carpocapsae]